MRARIRVSPSNSAGAWTYADLCAFTGGSDGSNPYDNVTFDKRGNIYGTTAFGGLGGGTVFQLSPPAAPGGPWTETTLHQFTVGVGGTRPWGDVVFGSDAGSTAPHLPMELCVARHRLGMEVAEPSSTDAVEGTVTTPGYNSGL